MDYLVDTNVMWRRIAADDSRHALVKSAVDLLLLNGHRLYVAAQNLVEFQALATRPASANGLGRAPSDVKRDAAAIEAIFGFLPDTPAIYPRWRALMQSYDVRGRPIFDARLVASMLVHGIPSLLTFDIADFHRYSEISVVDPAAVL